MIRAIAKKLYSLALGTNPPASFDPSASAVVFAPHPDDEVLGCGGIIALKTQAGADISIVHMTDGRHSHSHLMDEQKLAKTRRKESLKAAEKMGVPKANVVHLGFPDRELATNASLAQEKCKALLAKIQPHEVFVTSILDTTPDHRAATCIVSSAAKELGNETNVYEVPVWAWHHWPWVPIPRIGKILGAKTLLCDLSMGASFLKSCRWAIDVRAVLGKKQDALACYKSQTTRLVDSAEWTILDDVSEGEFKRCFFTGSEPVYRSKG